MTNKATNLTGKPKKDNVVDTEKTKVISKFHPLASLPGSDQLFFNFDATTASTFTNDPAVPTSNCAFIRCDGATQVSLAMRFKFLDKESYGDREISFGIACLSPSLPYSPFGPSGKQIGEQINSWGLVHRNSSIPSSTLSSSGSSRYIIDPMRITDYFEEVSVLIFSVLFLIVIILYYYFRPSLQENLNKVVHFIEYTIYLIYSSF